MDVYLSSGDLGCGYTGVGNVGGQVLQHLGRCVDGFDCCGRALGEQREGDSSRTAADVEDATLWVEVMELCGHVCKFDGSVGADGSNGSPIPFGSIRLSCIVLLRHAARDQECSTLCKAIIVRSRVILPTV